MANNVLTVNFQIFENVLRLNNLWRHKSFYFKLSFVFCLTRFKNVTEQYK